MREIHLELLIGTRVVGPDGAIAGRIEEVVVGPLGSGHVLREIHLGPHALHERLATPILGHPRGRRVRWEQLDLRDPEHPRLLCPVGELEELRSRDIDE